MPRKRTGTLQRFTEKSGAVVWRARLRLADGSRPWLRVPDAHSYSEERAREWAASMQEREDNEGKLAAAKVVIATPSANETVAKWSERWLKARETRGVVTFRHDQGRLKNHVLPHIGDLLMRTVTRADLEVVVEDLDRKISLPRGTDDGLAWKTAANVWVLVTKMFDDAVNAKARDLRVRADNPASGIRGPERGVARAQDVPLPERVFATRQLRSRRPPLPHHVRPRGLHVLPRWRARGARVGRRRPGARRHPRHQGHRPPDRQGHLHEERRDAAHPDPCSAPSAPGEPLEEPRGRPASCGCRKTASGRCSFGSTSRRRR